MDQLNCAPDMGAINATADSHAMPPGTTPDIETAIASSELSRFLADVCAEDTPQDTIDALAAAVIAGDQTRVILLLRQEARRNHLDYAKLLDAADDDVAAAQSVARIYRERATVLSDYAEARARRARELGDREATLLAGFSRERASWEAERERWRRVLNEHAGLLDAAVNARDEAQDAQQAADGERMWWAAVAQLVGVMATAERDADWNAISEEVEKLPEHSDQRALAVAVWNACFDRLNDGDVARSHHLAEALGATQKRLADALADKARLEAQIAGMELDVEVTDEPDSPLDAMQDDPEADATDDTTSATSEDGTSNAPLD
jgi:hypothetical protein